jgi:phage gp46-like protein
MTDIALLWDAETQQADFVMAGRYLAQTDELASAVVISLFTWARAKPDDPLPEPNSSRMGWWGDSFAAVSSDRIGSRLWLYQREKITSATLNRIEEAAEEALAWLVEDKLAARVEVAVERHDLNTVALLVTVQRGDGRAIELRFEDLWRMIGD